jgi:hypothetical protein
MPDGPDPNYPTRQQVVRFLVVAGIVAVIVAVIVIVVMVEHAIGSANARD